jgi:hypothetical protein
LIRPRLTGFEVTGDISAVELIALLADLEWLDEAAKPSASSGGARRRGGIARQSKDKGTTILRTLSIRSESFLDRTARCFI